MRTPNTVDGPEPRETLHLRRLVRGSQYGNKIYSTVIAGGRNRYTLIKYYNIPLILSC